MRPRSQADPTGPGEALPPQVLRGPRAAGAPWTAQLSPKAMPSLLPPPPPPYWGNASSRHWFGSGLQAAPCRGLRTDPNPRCAGQGARGELGAAPILHKPLAARGAATLPYALHRPISIICGYQGRAQSFVSSPKPLPSLPTAASLPPPRTPSPEGATVPPLSPGAPGVPAGTAKLAGCGAPQATFRGPPAPPRAIWPRLGFLGKPAWSSAQPPHTWACTGDVGVRGGTWACRGLWGCPGGRWVPHISISPPGC